jgi:Mrp family chromosome partitioning ATPase
MTAVDAVIRAWEAINTEQASKDGQEVDQRLELNRTKYANSIKAKQEQILAIGREFGSDSLDKMWDYKLEELSKLEAGLREAELALASARTGGAGATTQPGLAELPLETLADSVPVLRDYLERRRALEREIEALRLRLAEEHRDVLAAKTTLASLNRQIQEIADHHRGTTPAGPSGTDGPSIGELQARVDSIRALYDEAKSETFDLGRKRMQIESIRQEAETDRQRLAETQARIEQLAVESGVSGRLRVIGTGTRPHEPSEDRRAAFAAVGGLGLGGMGLGVVLLMGFIDRRVRHISDAVARFPRTNRILGALPTLAGDLADQKQALIAAQAVHHARALLQVEGGRYGHRAFALTSPSPGAGKTSLTLALGLSFAGSGSRTLLVDCDLVGGGLTRRLGRNTQVKIGLILQKAGKLDEQQVASVLEQAKLRGRRFAETAVALGYITTDDGRRALREQRRFMVGLREALAGEPLSKCVAATGIRDLALLPLGSARHQYIGRLSPAAVRRLLAQAKDAYDIVLVDTGPMLGSLEASVVVTAVDQVVLAVQRGEERRSMELASEHLAQHGTSVAGVIFNHAQTADLASSAYSSSVSRMSRMSMNDRLADAVNGEAPHGEMADLGGFSLNRKIADRYSKLGPIAAAIAALGEGHNDMPTAESSHELAAAAPGQNGGHR